MFPCWILLLFKFHIPNQCIIYTIILTYWNTSYRTMIAISTRKSYGQGNTSPLCSSDQRGRLGVQVHLRKYMEECADTSFVLLPHQRPSSWYPDGFRLPAKRLKSRNLSRQNPSRSLLLGTWRADICSSFLRGNHYIFHTHDRSWSHWHPHVYTTGVILFPSYPESNLWHSHTMIDIRRSVLAGSVLRLHTRDCEPALPQR